MLNIHLISALTNPLEEKLDEADRSAETSPICYTADEVFQRVKGRIHKRTDEN